MSATFYSVLGVEPTADVVRIKKRYYALCKQHHPDVNGDQQKMVAINEAYRILSSPILRASYDRELAVLRRQAQAAQAAASASTYAYTSPRPTSQPPMAERPPVYTTRSTQRRKMPMWPWVAALAGSLAVVYVALYVWPIGVSPAAATTNTTSPTTTAQVQVPNFTTELKNTSTTPTNHPVTTIDPAPTTDPTTSQPSTQAQPQTPTDQPTQPDSTPRKHHRLNFGWLTD